MNKEIDTLKKKDINLYGDFIKTVFDYDINKEEIEKLIKKNKVLVIKNSNKIIASVIIEEKAMLQNYLKK